MINKVDDDYYYFLLEVIVLDHKIFWDEGLELALHLSNPNNWRRLTPYRERN